MIGLPLDCTDSLTDKLAILSPTPIPYNSAGNTVTISNGYTDIFTQIKTVDCVLDSCSLREVGCAAPLASQSNVVLDATPFSITATETNPNGYTVSFCFQCLINKPDGSQLTFTKDSISAIGSPVDCTDSLTDASFNVSPAPVPYNFGGSTVAISNGYTEIFTHIKAADCVLDSCSLREVGCASPLAS